MSSRVDSLAVNPATFEDLNPVDSPTPPKPSPTNEPECRCPGPSMHLQDCEWYLWKRGQNGS